MVYKYLQNGGKGPGFLEIASFYTVCYSEVMLEQD